MRATININVLPGREYKISANDFTYIKVYYDDVLVAGPSLNNRFVAVDGVATLLVVSGANLTGTITLTEYLRNFYDMKDGQETVLAFQPTLNKWTSRYSYSPELFSMVGNRLVTFKRGYLYTHDSTRYNTFYNVLYDSMISFPHNESGNTVKSYESIAIEGSVPDRVHIRTESPYVQSSDIVAADFTVKEGVKYAPILRDRMSPNVSGDYTAKLYKGDKMRGEIGKFQVVFFQPYNKKELKFCNINFDPSRGQSV